MATPPNSNGFHNHNGVPNGNNGDNAPGLPDTHSDEFSRDASWDIQEVQDGEFEHYFHEHDGRLFHSHGVSLPYGLPIDTPEQERLNALHIVVKRLHDRNFIGPVPEVLAPVPDRQRLVLDFGSGTGRWVMEMASQFPHTQFVGLDIVPIATRRPLENVRFELHDINTPVRWLNNTVDFIHARDVSMALVNYPTLITEAARVLRPGGLFLSGEWEPFPVFNTVVNRPADRIPATYSLINMVNQTLHQRYRMIPVGPLIPGWLEQSGRFANVTPEVHFVPIGNWHQDALMQVFGNDMRATLVRYGESVRPMLKDAGYEETHIDVVLRAYVHELHTVPGLMGVYRTVHARKV